MTLRQLAVRAALILGIALLAALVTAVLWLAGEGLLVLFTAVVLAVVLDGLADIVSRHTPLPRAAALALTVVVLAAALGGLLWTAGARMAGQAPELRDSLQQSIGSLESHLRQLGVSPAVFGGAMASGNLVHEALSTLLAPRGPVAETLRFAGDLVVIVVAGIYFAVQPQLYSETALKLFPIDRRDRLRQVLQALANALRRWMAGRLVAMLAVGVMTTIGMLLLNVRLAVLLGFIAGVLTFIPYLGVVISLIPAVLIALLSGLGTALYVVLLFFGAHVLEGYLLTPLIQREAVHMAPAWLIVAQVFGFLLAGVFGIAMATPAAVVVTIVVQMLYIEDVLGDRVRLLGG